MALTGGQKLCLFMVLLGSLALLAGSAAPFWITLDVGLIKSTYGLWFGCVETAVTSNTCEDYGWFDATIDDFEVWFYLVHVTAGLASILSILLVLISMAKLCGNTESAKSAGWLALFAGLLGIGTCVVFYLEPEESINSALASIEHRDWAFIVYACGTGVLFFFGIPLIAMSPHNEVSPY